MDYELMQRFFAELVEPEVITEAYQDIVNDVTSYTRFNQDLFELKMGDIRASMSLKPGDGIETFKCNCNYHGKGLCKHFIFLFHAASNTILQLAEQTTKKSPSSTLEYKVTRSKAITPELKTIFKTFQKDFKKLWQIYLESKDKRKAYKNLSNLYQSRNEAINACFIIAKNARIKDSIFNSFEIIIYGLFQMCKIMGYDNEKMLDPIKYLFYRQLKILFNKAKAPEKQKMWDYIAKSLRQSNTDKLPRNPAREIILDFLLENYDTDRYYNANLDLLDELIDYATMDGNECLAEELAVEYLWHLSDSDISEDDLFQAYHEWWHVSAIRLNYLEHCMATHNYLTALTIATESLSDSTIFNEEETVSLHRILLGASFKTSKYNKTIEEAKILADLDPETLLFEINHFLAPDKARWNKIKTKITPIIDKLAC